MTDKSSVKLRPISPDDTGLIVKWRNQPEVRNYLFTRDPLTPEQHLSWYKSKVLTGLCHQFIIELDEHGVILPIGSIFLKNVDVDNSKAEHGFFIGECSQRGNGYSYKATSLVLEYGFETLGLNRIYASILLDNVASIESHKKSGFRVEGILKQDVFLDDIFKDVVLVGITRDTWQKREL